MSDKTYVGNGKEITTQYGELLKLSFSRDDLQVMNSKLNAKGYVNLNCNRRKEVGQYGHTHSIVIDDWIPNQPQQQAQPAQQQGFVNDSMAQDYQMQPHPQSQQPLQPPAGYQQQAPVAPTPPQAPRAPQAQSTSPQPPNGDIPF